MTYQCKKGHSRDLRVWFVKLKSNAYCLQPSWQLKDRDGRRDVIEGRAQETALRQGSTEDHGNCSCRYWGEAHSEEKSCSAVGMSQTHRQPVFIAVLLMEQLVLDHDDCPIEEVLYSSSLVPGLTGITVHLAKDFIHCPFILAIVNHLRLCIFMPKPANNPPAMLLMVRNCQVPFLLFIYFCLGNEDTVNTYKFKWYSI